MLVNRSQRTGRSNLINHPNLLYPLPITCIFLSSDDKGLIRIFLGFELIFLDRIFMVWRRILFESIYVAGSLLATWLHLHFCFNLKTYGFYRLHVAMWAGAVIFPSLVYLVGICWTLKAPIFNMLILVPRHNLLVPGSLLFQITDTPHIWTKKTFHHSPD